MKQPTRPRVCVVTLGCSKNQVDAEYALGELARQGFRITAEAEAADILLVNTCAFIRSAETETIQALMEAVRLKKRHRIKQVLVAGCLVSKYGESRLKQLIPEIDGALMPGAVKDWVDSIQTLSSRAAVHPVKTRNRPRQLLSGPGTAYLKIAEGCSRHCSYCLIPRLRGPLRSRPLPELAAEAKELARQGIQELIVVAQDTTQYGRDLANRPSLPDLLDELVKIPRLRWIRIMYANPEGVDTELIQRLAQAPKLCKYLDMPVQHSEARILRAMRRPYSREWILNLVQRLRREIPALALRSTVLSGFPGETEAEHRALLSFIAEARFDRLGGFAYSCEAGTPAAAFQPQIAPATRQRRMRDVLKTQQAVSRARLQERVGQTVECLVEEASGSKHVLARTVWDAPEVDGVVILTGRAKPGTIVRAKIMGATDHDLRGVLL